MKTTPTKNNAVIFKEPTMKKRRRSCGNACLLLVGILLTGVGIGVFVYFEQIYDLFITNALAFNPESEAFRVWRKNDPPLDMDIYLFNWTNPEQIRSRTAKPHFEPCGPYRFKEVKEKINVTWNANDTITYRHKKSYFFDGANSERDLSDVITTINAVPLTIAHKARDYGYFSKRTISYSLSSLSSLYVTKTARQILFDGYEESILSILSSVPMVNVKDKFGFFYGKNGTAGDDGVFSMWTTNDANFGRIVTWNHRNHSGLYEGECGAVRGSAGEFYPINRDRKSIEIYSAELCKFATLEYEKDVYIKGVRGYKYTAKHIFDNGTLRPENKCFCNGQCVPSGLLNVSSCRQGSPTFLSMPHFYGADPFYRDAIDGVEPADNHEFYIILEPKSGIVIDIAARMQVNLLLQPVDHITMFEDLPTIFVPIFYFDQALTMSDELAFNMALIQNLPEISNIFVLILVSLGVMALIWLTLNIYCCSKTKFDDEFKIPHEEIPLRT